MELWIYSADCVRDPLRAEKCCDGAPWSTKVIVVDFAAAAGVLLYICIDRVADFFLLFNLGSHCIRQL